VKLFGEAIRIVAYHIAFIYKIAGDALYPKRLDGFLV